ncbi:GNAT family N-acetyltransferase [Shouchella shacheensis]|uniref:GNAT family N-acetyltransferase n=1 Tax=Shouchella shacheensis TaxID=1649580 RepID=UPI00074025E1|nr:GNAT family N-acetyltransferase [Shouchella shacheensis]
MYIRPYQEKDKERIISLSERFSDIEFMDYRNQEAIERKQIELAKDAVSVNASNLFVAEQDNEFLGYIELTEDKDYFTNERVAYISAIAVTSAGEGKGTGKLLMSKAETWCLEQSCKQLVLDVFKANAHAICFYEHLGFEEEIVKMVKIVE